MRQKRNSPWSSEWNVGRDIDGGVGKISNELWIG
jgi:hypothetical protein